MRVAHVLAVVLAIGCAKGGADAGDAGQADAPTHHVDAHPQVIVDAPVTHIDASVLVDAPVQIDASLAPDASTDGNLCTANAMCTDVGECCLSINGVGFCAPGIIIGTTCLPQ